MPKLLRLRLRQNLKCRSYFGFGFCKIWNTEVTSASASAKFEMPKLLLLRLRQNLKCRSYFGFGFGKKFLLRQITNSNNIKYFVIDDFLYFNFWVILFQVSIREPFYFYHISKINTSNYNINAQWNYKLSIFYIYDIG